MKNRFDPDKKIQSGFSMIEVLVTVVIIVVGLLGLVGLQSKASLAEMESYQRGQGLALAQDLKDHLMSSRGLYATPNGFKTFASASGTIVFGTGSYITGCGSVTGVAEKQLCLWGETIKGVAESSGSSSVGAMINARGCLIDFDSPSGGAIGDVFIVVVWQGLVATSDPASGTPGALCASGMNYGSGLRKAVVMRVMIPKLVS